MNWREQALKKIAKVIYQQYPFIIVVAVLLAIASLGLTGLFLKTKTGRIDLVSEKNPASKRFLNFLEEFGSPDDLVLIFAGGDAQHRQKAAQHLAQNLAQEKKWIETVFYRVPLDFFKKRGLFYLDTATLQNLDHSLAQLETFLAQTKGGLSLASLFDQVDSSLKKGFRERRLPTDSEKKGFEWLSQFLSQLNLFFTTPEKVTFDSLVSLELPQKDKHPLQASNGFIVSNSGQYLFMFVKPAQKTNDFKFIKGFIHSAQKEIDQMKTEFAGVEVEMTGVPPIIYEEMVTTTRDVSKTSVLSFLGITLLFMLCFQAFRKPLMVATVMFMGIAYTFCFATFAVGSLNLMSIVFASMLLGSGNDFGVHILMRYREERLNGHSCQAAIETVVSQTGQGILSGALATALVFYTLMFSNFKGFSEFGLISGTGVLICAVAMLVVVPAFLVLWEKSGKGTAYYDRKIMKQRHQLTMPHVAKLLHYPKTVLALSLVLTGFFFYTASSVGFNGSLLDIQAKGSQSFANEQKMLDDSPLSPRFGAVLAKNIEDLKLKKEALQKLPAVGRVESILDFLPDVSSEKLKWIQQIKTKADQLVLKKEAGALDVKSLIQKINQLQKKLALIQSRKEIGFLVELKEKLDRVLASWDRLPLSYVERELKRFEQSYQSSIEQGLNQIREMDLSSGISFETLPSEIKQRFIGKNGDFLIYVFPKKSVWSDAALTRFTEELLLVDPQATGTPFLVQEVTQLMEKGYVRSGWLALLVVTLLLLIDFRRVVPTLLALVPLLMGVVWMVGLMGLLGMDFNPANLIAVPLILGIAIDNGVHLVHRFYEKKAHRLDHIMQSTIKAVYLNSITTIACFGALILASHRGISSLGLVLVLGVLTCLITAITFLPALLSLLRDRAIRPKQ